MISVIIPTYNEKGNIVKLIRGINRVFDVKKTSHEVIVIDDNSPDKTAEIVRKNFVKNKNIRVFVRKNARGLATAIFLGIKKAGGEIVVGMDADLNHPPSLIPTLIKGLKNADLSVASRFVKGGGMEEKWRLYPTRLFNFFLKNFLGFPTMDNLSGFYAIKKENLMRLPLKYIYRGYGEYHLRLVYFGKKAGYKIKETPVFYKKRIYGKSKTVFLPTFFKYLFTALVLKISGPDIVKYKHNDSSK